MKSKNRTVLGQLLTSYLLGCIMFYIFLGITGVVIAFLLKHGVDSFIVYQLIKSVRQAGTRLLIFSAYFHLTHMVVNVVVVFLFTYFLSKYITKKILIGSVVITLGAITTDLYHFRKMSIGSSYFFSGSYEIDFLDFTAWFICTIASIKLAYLLKVKGVNKNAQPRGVEITKGNHVRG